MIEPMLLTRISRGAARASLLVQNKMSQYRLRMPTKVWRPARALLLIGLVSLTVLRPVSLVAPATAVAAGPDNADPSPRVVRVSIAAQQALQLARTDQLALTVNAASLQPIIIGQSEVDAKIAADKAAELAAAQKVAEEAAAAAEAAKKAAAEALRHRIVAQYGDSEIQNIIIDAANVYGVSSRLMLSIAQCESGFSPGSKNAHSAASGLFQFMPSTYANSPSGEAGLSIWDAKANAEAAAFKIANGGLNAWNASRGCWGN